MGRKVIIFLTKKHTVPDINESIQDIPHMSRHRTLHPQYPKIKTYYKVDKDIDKKKQEKYLYNHCLMPYPVFPR